MTAKLLWRCNWHTVALLCLLSAAISAEAATGCKVFSASWQPAFVSSLSDWKEFDIVGRQLVHESGRLRGPKLAVNVRCDDWTLQAAMSRLEGSRWYDGQTSAGVPAVSSSALRQRNGHLQSTIKVTDAWQWGGRLSSHTLWRDIASTASASGFPERFDWTVLSIGAQWKTALGPGQLTLAAWTGAQVSSTMLLSLPGRDQTVLKLGSIRQTEVASGWRNQLSPAWHLQVDISYRRITMGQGEEGIIKRGGIPVGIAFQPRTTMVDQPITVRMGYEF